MPTKTVYKLSNMNGRFDHAYGIAAAVKRANEMSEENGLSRRELEDMGWTFRRCTPAQARAVGMGD